jgi:hypothetical protein
MFPKFPSKVKNWQDGFFYLKATPPMGEVSFLPYMMAAFSLGPSIPAKLSDDDLEALKPLEAKIYFLIRKGLKARNLIACWMLWKIQPLSPCSMLLCKYRDELDDEDRCTDKPWRLTDVFLLHEPTLEG